MKKIAKLLSMILVVATFLSLCTFSANAVEFKDVSAQNEVLYEAVELLHSLGVAKGQSETSYGVNKNVTREQMAAFIFRLMNRGKSVEGGENTTPFTDLKDDTFFSMVSWANDMGIIKGRSATEFDPSGKITLQDCYVMLTRALHYEKDGPLNYPYGYIDIAEKIGLDKNIGELQYEDTLTRGKVAIILHNAFYADMNKIETKSEWIDVPDSSTSKYVTRQVNATVASSIFDVQRIVRRIVATPNYGIDITSVGTGSEYKKYTPTGGDTIDKDLICTAAICPGESVTRLEKEKSVIEFEKIGLSGNPDDYFLYDIVMFMTDDGEILAADVLGETVDGATATLEQRQIKVLEDRLGGTKGGAALYTGCVSFGLDKAYLYNKPSSVPNKAITIVPTSADDEGRMQFTANKRWNGNDLPNLDDSGAVSQAADPKTFNKQQSALHNSLKEVMSTAIVDKNYSTKYYDSNNDGFIEYLWIQPYTFGKVVNTPGDDNRTIAKHTGDSKYRAVYNPSKKIPEIYISGAKLEGGKAEQGQYIMAYVAGPANYIKVAPDTVNKSLVFKELTCVKRNVNNNVRTFEDGSIIAPGDSFRTIVGHITSENTGIVSMSYDEQVRDGDTINNETELLVGKKYSFISYGGRVLLFNELEDAQTMDIANKYAIVRYTNKAKGEVVFNAGGIEADGSLTYYNHVQAFVDGEFKLVKIAKKVLVSPKVTVDQDDAYFTGKSTGTAIVDTLCTYKVDEDGAYTFIPIEVTNDAENLTDKDNETLIYTTQVQRPVGFEKVTDDMYRFVPGLGESSVPSQLSPNGTQYFYVDKGTKIVVNYVNENGQPDYAVYADGNYPDFDPQLVQFTKTIAVIRNSKTGTIAEHLAFLYAEVGGDIVDKVVADKNFRIVLSNIQIVDDNDNAVNKYTVVDPLTGNITEDVDTHVEGSMLIPNYMFYKFTDEGKIQNNSAGLIANLAKNSPDLTTITTFEQSADLLFVANKTKPYIVDDKTVYALLDRETGNLTIESSDMLLIDDEADADDTYHNVDENDETQKTIFVTSEEREENPDFEYATLVLVVRG